MFMSKNLLYVWLFVQFDLSEMLWSSSVVEKKKELWIRVWLAVMKKHVEKCAGKITQTHIALQLPLPSPPELESFVDHQIQNWPQTLPWLCLWSLTRVRFSLCMELTFAFISLWLLLADTLIIPFYRAGYLDSSWHYRYILMCKR